ncbi:FtsX-like permease family protein [Oceanirhabdus sp. W0125-5]|uniref:FtsX-like permease family protein n=1 Tax=Oceanirhabdus sp. W0125-5 TaxID=2999116 RepID=UPI0022F2DE06|nr:ABC transporter permease [Oceanirhabdus sp. W0125-5]WBW96878.1 ABC transporter permease [Oceanirhabdus sp. W0125-5]
MNTINIARKNMGSNIKTYGIHLVAMIFSVMIYYNFSSLKYNAGLFEANGFGGAIKWVAGACAFLLILFLAFFIWYSNSVFLKHRKREIGIYSFMGLRGEEIGRIYAVETIFIGVIAIFSGVLLGVLTNKLFIMILLKVMSESIKVKFYISKESILETILIFTIFFLISSFTGYINICRSKLIDLFNAAKTEEKPQKISVLKGILSIVIMGFAYYYYAYDFNYTHFNRIPLVVGLVVGGTFWLFQALIPSMIKGVQRDKKLFYRGVNIIAVSNLTYRIRKNYKSLTAVAILVASSITAFGCCYSFKYDMDIARRLDAPFHLGVISQKEEDYSSVKNIIKEIKVSGTEVQEIISVDFIEMGLIPEEDGNVDSVNHIVAKYSEVEKLVRALEGDKGEKILSNIDVGEGKVTYIRNSGSGIAVIYPLNLKRDNVEFTLTKDVSCPTFGKIYNKLFLIMGDEDYERYKGNLKEYRYTGVNIKDKSKLIEITNNLKDKLSDNKFFSQSFINPKDYAESIVVAFLGGIMAMVFMAASGVMVYFNIISEAYMDKEKYERLMNIGVTKGEIWLVIVKQGAIQCILPLLVGILHGCVALSALSHILYNNQIVPITISIATLSIVYIIFYFLAINKFIKVVTKKRRR